MNQYQQVCDKLKTAPKTWLVTGVAGFIGSNLLNFTQAQSNCGGFR